MEKKHGKAQRIWVMDRGMVSEGNLSFLRRRDGRYIVGTPKASLRKFETELVAKKDWDQVEAGVEVKLVPSPDGEETFILARSAERREKERAIHERFLHRMEDGLQKLKAAMESGRLHDEATAHRRLGRLQGKNPRAAKAFDVTIQRLLDETMNASADGGRQAKPRVKNKQQPSDANDNAKKKARLQISWQRNESWAEWARVSEGCYLLRSNLNDTDAKTLWKHYIQLTDAEWAFRITKDELVLRPIWHHKEHRVQAHILICFLAFAMWKTLAGWMRGSGLGDAPRTVLDELAKIKSADIVLPICSNSGPAQTVRLRCVTEPDTEQKLLLHRLGIGLPKRLGAQLLPPQM
jgi:transposase